MGEYIEDHTFGERYAPKVQTFRALKMDKNNTQEFADFFEADIIMSGGTVSIRFRDGRGGVHFIHEGDYVIDMFQDGFLPIDGETFESLFKRGGDD